MKKTISISNELHKKLRVLCAENDWQLNEAVEHAIQDFIHDREQQDETRKGETK